MDWRYIVLAIVGLVMLAGIMEGAPLSVLLTLIAGATCVGVAAFITKSPIGEAIAERIRNYEPNQLDSGEKQKRKKKKSQFEIDLEGDIEGFLDDLMDGIFPNRRSKQAGTYTVSRESRDGKPEKISDFPEGMIAVMFTDMEEFTRYIERGDAQAFDILKKHNKIVTESAEQFDGRVVKGYGDGFMIAFTSARKAVSAAYAIQELLKKHNEDSLSSEAIKVRIGIDAGEPIKEGDDYIGRTVNLAARIAATARGGQIFVSSTVKQLVGPIDNLQFIDIGPHSLKGFEEKQRLFEVEQIQALSHGLESDITRGLSEIERKLKRGD